MSEIVNINLNKVVVKLGDTDDPVALTVSWEPAGRGGASFKTQDMHVTDSLVSIVRSAAALWFALAFAIPGVIVLFVAAPYMFYQGKILDGIFMLVWGAGFTGVAWLLLHSGKRMTLDKLLGVYYKGAKFDQFNTIDRKQQGRLNDIYAVQLIQERLHSNSTNGGSSRYTSYELNLVFKDGERLNVMDHGKRDEIDQSAISLGKFLGVPVWKAQY